MPHQNVHHSMNVIQFVDTRAKRIRVVGSHKSVIKTVAAVTQKVQAIQTRPDLIRETRGQNAYLEDMSTGQVAVPGHWKSVKSLAHENAFRVPVDRAVAKAVEDIVQKTWPQHLAGQGRDAAGISRTATIAVITVEQIENSHLYSKYEYTRKVFRARAMKGTARKPSYPKVTSDRNEQPVLTSKQLMSQLDNQLFPDINEYFLFHGAPQQHIEAILNQGIDTRLSGKGMFGKGAYFCENSMKADQYAGNK